MSSTREQIREALDRLSDEEARELLSFVREIERPRDGAAVLERLADDPSFRLPVAGQPTFDRFESIIAPGRAASEMLTEDRR
jgi:hypothetical protein